MKTIIYVHPWEGSLNHAILDKTKEILTNRGEKFQVIDLHEDDGPSLKSPWDCNENCEKIKTEKNW